MKPNHKVVLCVLLVTLGASVLHFISIALLMVTGIGPFGRGTRLLASGEMSTYDQATSEQFFSVAAQWVRMDRYVLWPVVFLVASMVYVKAVHHSEWWHFLLIACAVLPMSLPAEHLPLPEISPFAPWRDLIVQVLAYSALVGLFCLTYRKATSRMARPTAAA